MKLKYLVASIAISLSLPVHAEKVMFACQYVKSAGLEWRSNHWMPIEIKVKAPFFLSSDKEGLTKESVAKALDSEEKLVTCSAVESFIQSCHAPLGETLIFDLGILSGGVSKIYGASQSRNSPYKDTVSVTAFVCAKM